ncbi:MAG: DNA repair protein RecO [Tepidisphaeraceae bacterium]
MLDEAAALLGDKAERDLNILAEWKIVEGFRPLRKSMRSLALSLYLAELIGELFEVMDPHPPIYDRFRHALTQLGTPGCEESALAMLLDLLRAAGYLPSLTRCASCGQPTAGERMLYFSGARGGVICRNCEAVVPDRVSIDARLVGIVVNILRLPRENGAAVRLPRLTRAQTDPLHEALADHIEHVIQKRLRLKRHVVARRAAAARQTVSMKSPGQ